MRLEAFAIQTVTVALWAVALTVMGGCDRRPVKPEALANLIDRADKVVILETPMSGAPVLYESSGRQDLDALKLATRVSVPEQPLHCRCIGSPAIDLYSNGQRIGRMTNHHGKLLRCELWNSDAPIIDSEAFLTWFDERKVAGPRQEWNDAIARQMQSAADRKRWLAAMPSSLKILWPAVEQTLDADVAPLDRALVQDIPEESERVRALLGWYGSGAGPWSGFPSYEEAAEKLLLRYPTRSILAAIEGRQLTETQTEGAARLFGGWSFSQARPRDLRLLPQELTRRLLAHSLKSSDEDKRGRAERAFEERRRRSGR